MVAQPTQRGPNGGGGGGGDDGGGGFAAAFEGRRVANEGLRSVEGRAWSRVRIVRRILVAPPPTCRPDGPVDGRPPQRPRSRRSVTAPSVRWRHIEWVSIESLEG